MIKQKPTPHSHSPHLAAERWKKGLLIGAVLVAAVAVAVVVRQSFGLARQRLWTELAQATSLASQGKSDEALRHFQSVATGARFGSLTCLARLGEASLRRSESKFSEALEAYRAAGAAADRPPLAALALAGQAAMLEELGRLAESQARYEEFVKLYPDHALALRSEWEIGRLLAAQGQSEKAVKQLQQLITLDPQSHWAEQAQNFLKELPAHTPSQ